MVRRVVTTKHRLTFNRLQGVISQETELFILTLLEKLGILDQKGGGGERGWKLENHGSNYIVSSVNPKFCLEADHESDNKDSPGKKRSNCTTHA
jgi:hypothetical protein